jgi:hypothetical protein
MAEAGGVDHGTDTSEDDRSERDADASRISESPASDPPPHEPPENKQRDHALGLPVVSGCPGVPARPDGPGSLRGHDL